MRRLITAREVVEALGGLEAVCELTGANAKAVYHWTGQTDSFPSRTYVVMQRALKRRHMSAPPSMWNMVGVEKIAA
jgi:hypothetical protein